MKNKKLMLLKNSQYISGSRATHRYNIVTHHIKIAYFYINL